MIIMKNSLKTTMLMLMLMMISLTVSQNTFDRENDNLGYLLDATLEDYDVSTGSAKFKCSLDLFIRRTRPAYFYQKVGLLTLNETSPAQAGDRGNNNKITSGSRGANGEMQARTSTLHKCEVRMADERTDVREIDVIYLDGYPIVWFQSSKYPEAETVPYGATFWIVYSSLGINVEEDLGFSLCDPRRSECISASNRYNEEAYPDVQSGEYGKRTLMTGMALRSGYYTVTASNDIAPRQAYFHLKVAEPVPATWSRDANINRARHRITAGNDLTLNCDFTAPVPYRHKRYWFKNGSYRIQPSDKFIFSNNNGMLTLRDVGTQDAGDYRCRVDFTDWTSDVPTLDATTKVEVTGGNRPSTTTRRTTTTPDKENNSSLNLASPILVIFSAVLFLMNIFNN